MIKRTLAVVLAALTIVPFMGAVASASDLVDSTATEKVECLFRVYINEGGESGLDCLD